MKAKFILPMPEGLDLHGMSPPAIYVEVDSRADAEEALVEMKRDINPAIRLEVAEEGEDKD